MGHIRKTFEELDIIDDFLMNALANDPDVSEIFCRTLVSSLLQCELGKIRVSVQRVIPSSVPERRSIRMDVEVEEYEEIQGETITRTIYDIEPHQQENMDLLRHNRFYQAKIDSQNLKSGERDFVTLPNLFVVTITNYDPFGYDYMMYTIHNKCEEIPELKYEDGLHFLYFYTKGSKGGNTFIKQLLNYIQNSTIDNVTNEATQKLHDCVSRVKVSPEVRFEYMMWEEKVFYLKRDAKEEGHQLGLQQGLLDERLRLVSAKLAKGKTVEQIADELELTLEEVNEIIISMNEKKGHQTF